jgi:hypothetical protein
MSLSISGFAPAAQASSSLGLGVPPTASQSPADKAKAAVEARKAAQQQMLDEVKKKGIYAWAQEQKWEKLKEKIRAQIMSERGLTEDSLSGMNAADRQGAEASIQEEITRSIQEAMRSELETKARQGPQDGKAAAPALIDISV